MRFSNFYVLLLVYFFAAGCGDDDALKTPKPKGYLRVTFPEKSYVKYDTLCPFVFDYPTYAQILPDELPNAEPCWINIDFPGYKGRIHLTYKKIENNLPAFLEDSRTFAVKHQQKASAIDEQIIVNDKNKVYGLVYDIRGNTASSLQFYLTDSTRHFIRGALYFSAKPNADSLAPVIDFVRRDIYRLIESFEWKASK